MSVDQPAKQPAEPPLRIYRASLRRLAGFVPRKMLKRPYSATIGFLRRLRTAYRMLATEDSLGQRTYVLEEHLFHLRDQLDLLKSSLELSTTRREEILRLKAQPLENDPPLVSVCIATFNRAQLLTERSLPSVLRQTYPHLEVIVVGDGCQDDTEARIRALRDSRVRYVNLQERGSYPADPQRCWMVAGTPAMNHALSLCRGDFITHLDDDDAYALDRLEKLVDFALTTGADFVWHPFWYQDRFGAWFLRDVPRLTLGSVTTSSMFYRRWLRAIGWDIDAHWLMEPGDWNRIRRIKFLGPEVRRFDEPLTWHHREKTQAATAAAA